MILLEVCVDSVAGLDAAVAGGADRIELCAALSEGGLTPSAGLMHAAAKAPVPVYAMIRPRGGHFCFSAAEAQVMLHDIAAARAAGLAGVVLGAATPAGALDTALLAQLTAAAGGLGTTLHRVIDTVRDPAQALDQAMALGFERVLTSGGARTAPDGTAQIAQLVAQARGRISIMPGAGVTADTVAELVATTGVQEVHASCRSAPSVDARSGLLPGDTAGPVTDPGRIGALRRALASAGK